MKILKLLGIHPYGHFRVRKNAPESFTERFAGSGMCPLEYAQVRMETNAIMETYEGM